MYYRVAGYKKNDDLREMIVRANTKQEAEKQIPAAKAFLFPGEDTENYHCFVIPVPIKVNLGTTIPHYRITVERPKSTPQKPEEDFFDDSWWETVLSAESAEEAKAKGREDVQKDGDNPDEYDFYADEMTVEECIKEEERSIHHLIETTYLHLIKKDNLSIREYAEFQRQFDVDSNPEQYYEALKGFNKYLRLLRRMLRTCDQESCTVKQFVDTSEKLYECQDKESFEKVFSSLKSEKEMKE